MDSDKKYATPWATKRYRLTTDILDAKGESFGAVYKSTPNDESVPDRIVACVNACAGIEDPAATLAEVREALRYAKMYLENDGHEGLAEDCADALALLGPGPS